MCLFLRLVEFTGERENKDRLKKAKPPEVIQTSLADRFSQLQDAESAWKKKVRKAQLCLVRFSHQLVKMNNSAARTLKNAIFLLEGIVFSGGPVGCNE